MRKIILSMQITLDGFIAGPNGEMDWIIDFDEEMWQHIFDLLMNVDTFFLGRVMYPDYANYWRAVLANPIAPKNEIKYARIAEKTQHIVFSKTLERTDWENTKIESEDLAKIVSKLKHQSGKDIIIWGGATLASNFINLDLIDEYQLWVNPVILGGGKALFKNVNKKYQLQLIETKALKSGAVLLRYRNEKRNSLSS